MGLLPPNWWLIKISRDEPGFNLQAELQRRLDDKRV